MPPFIFERDHTAKPVPQTTGCSAGEETALLSSGNELTVNPELTMLTMKAMSESFSLLAQTGRHEVIL